MSAVRNEKINSAGRSLVPYHILYYIIIKFMYFNKTIQISNRHGLHLLGYLTLNCIPHRGYIGDYWGDRPQVIYMVISASDS